MQGIMLFSKLNIHVIDMFYSCMLLLCHMIRLLCSNHVCYYYSRIIHVLFMYIVIIFKTCMVLLWSKLYHSFNKAHSNSVLTSTNTILIFCVSFSYQVFNSILNQNHSTYGYYLFTCFLSFLILHMSTCPHVTDLQNNKCLIGIVLKVYIQGVCIDLKWLQCVVFVLIKHKSL